MDIDDELKQTLTRLLDLCREFGVHPRLIGGLAVHRILHLQTAPAGTDRYRPGYDSGGA
jgi:hypothetical protein